MTINDAKFYEIEAYIHNIITSNNNILNIAGDRNTTESKYVRTHYTDFNNKLSNILKSFKELKK